MEPAGFRKDQYAGIPFYILFSLLLGTLAVLGTLSISTANPPVITFFYVLLYIFHIGLYWLNLNLYRNGKWQFAYYVSQTILIIGIANFPYGTNIGLTILSSMSICMIGEAVGLWGNTRRSLLLGLFYVVLVLTLFYLLGERDALIFSVSSFLINGGFIVMFLVVLNQQLKERKKAEDLAESLESANAKLAASAAKIESLTLQNERQRMARELHDTLAQGVAGLVLQLEAVKAHLASNRNERASAIVEQAIIRARSTLAESRAAIDDLRAAPANLADSVHEMIKRFKQATGLPCVAEVSVTENQLSPETANHALNILSETLTNIARHAQATQVRVKFSAHSQTLELEVHDNGKGFDVNQNISGHYGLLGMHERARLTGGALAIESNQNGTSVQFVVGRS